MAWKRVEQMTGPEVVSEAESLASYAASCRVIGQGINSKEVVRFNQCIERIETERLTDPEHIASIRIGWDERLAGNRNMLVSLYRVGGTLEGMRRLMEPA